MENTKFGTFDKRDFDPFMGANESTNLRPKKSPPNTQPDVSIQKDCSGIRGNSDPLKEYASCFSKCVPDDSAKDETGMTNILFPEILTDFGGDGTVKDDISNIAKAEKDGTLTKCDELPRKSRLLSCIRQEENEARGSRKKMKTNECRMGGGEVGDKSRSEQGKRVIQRSSSMPSAKPTPEAFVVGIQDHRGVFDSPCMQGAIQRSLSVLHSPVKITQENLLTTDDFSRMLYKIGTTSNSGIFQDIDKINKTDASDAWTSLDSGQASPMPNCPYSVEKTPSSGFGSFTDIVATDYGTPLSISKRGNSTAVVEETYMVDEHSRVDLVSILQRNYTRIKREIDPSWRLADELFQAEIIDERVYDNIKSSRDMAQRRADLLIKALAYDISSSKFHAFKATLRKCGYRYIADVLAGNNKNKDFNKYKDASQYQKYRSLQGKLNKLRDLLLQEFEPKLVIDELLEMEIISFIEHEDIWTAQSNEDRIDLVLKCVKKNVEINLGPFCSILQKHSQWLEKEIDLLQKEEESPSESDTRPVLKLFCKDGDWTFHPEGSFKNHPDMNIHIEFNTEKKQNVDVKVVERHKNSAKHVLDIPVSKLHLQFAELEKGSIVIRLQPLSSRALRKLKESKPEDIIAIVQSLLTNEDLQALKASKLTGIKIKIEASRTSLQAPVSMKEDGVTREAIVRNFSYLSESLGKVKEFIPAFLQDKHLPENSKENLKQLLILKSEDRNEAFLRFLLHEESGRSRILFQRQLCKMKQASILRILDNTDKEFKEALGKNEMQMNYSYLLDELEGREFLKAFAEKELFDDEICDKILRPRNRRERTKLFVDFLLSGKNDVRTFFFQELEAHHPAIYNVLFSTKLASQSSSESQSALSSMKAAICERFDEVIKEIEPKIYRDAFVERKIFTIQEYDELVKLSPRRERAAIFLTRLLHSNNVFAMKTFIWVLQRTGNQYLANNLENDFYMLDGEDVVAFPENECADECTLMTAILDARIVITGDKPGNSSENGSHLSECPNQSKDSESTPTDIYSPGKNPTEQRASDQKVISWLQSSVGKNEHIVQCTMTGDLSSDETPSSQSTSQALTEDVLSSHEEKVIDKVSDHDLTKEVASCTTSIKSSTQSCEEDVFGRKRHRRPVSAPLTKTKILKRCQHKESERKMLRRRNSAATHEALSAPVNSHIYYNNDCDSACMSVISPDFRGEDAYSERQSNDSLKSSSKIKNDQRDI